MQAAAKRRGVETPDAIANRPELDPELGPVWDTFWDLDSCRPLGFGTPGPIPWTALRQHQQVYGYGNDVFDYLWELLRAMDAAYLNHLAEKAKPK